MNIMYDTEPVGKSADREIWAYDLTRRWHRVPDPLPPPRPTEDFEVWLRRGGFDLSHQHGVEDACWWLEVYECADGEPFLVVVNRASRSETVFVATLPDLMALLGELLPVVVASLRLEAAAEEYERKMQIRRKGGTYNAAKRCMEMS
jgi:hypothetical protein